jgi:hypothetical protein
MALSIWNRNQSPEPVVGSNLSRRMSHISMWWILAALGLVQFADAVMTQVLVGHGQIREGNPLMANLVSGGQFLPFKLVVIATCCLTLWLLSRKFPLVARSASLVIVCYYCVILWSNASIAF